MLRCGYKANARVSRWRRGETIRAPMPETFPCERARTAIVGVAPHRAQVRRSTGIIMNPVSSTQIRWAPSRRSFFYPDPLLLDPRADPPIVALLGPRLGSLRTEAGRPEQPPHVVRMVDDIEMLTDQVDDPAARPQAGSIAGLLRPGDYQAGESASLRHREFRWSTGCRPGAQASAALSSVRLLPPTDRPPVDA